MMSLLLWRSWRTRGRLGGLQLIDAPAAGAFDREADVLGLSQFLVAGATTNGFHADIPA